MSKKIFYYKSIDSTQVKAEELANKGYEEWTIVYAEKQKKGKGRYGRKWYSPANKNIYFSVILRPNLDVSKTFYLTIFSALAIANLLKKDYKVGCFIKYPNDIFVLNKKLAGILVNTKSENNNLKYGIVGIGINVNEDFKKNKSLKRIATSLKIIKNKKINRQILLKKIIKALKKYYVKLKQHKFDLLYSEWLHFLKKQVNIGG